MPVSPSGADLSSIGLPTTSPEVGQPSVDRAIAVIETQDRTTLPLSQEQFEHVARHPTRRDVPPIRTDQDQLPMLPQHLVVSCSPATRLPPETLAYIFELCEIRGNELTPVLVPAQGLFDLTQVCKLWRAVAESHPRLWTSVQFYFPESHQNREEDVPRVKPVFDLYLKRSGALPMSLAFTDHRTYHSATEGLISLLVYWLRTHARRWERISLQLSCSYFPLLFTFAPCSLSSLEHLCISGDVPAHREVGFVRTLRLDLESAPNLKSFTYNGPDHSMNDVIYLRWESLAEVSFEFVPHTGSSLTLSRQFRHLARCQSLTTCSLGIGRPFPPGLGAITLPCLQTLRVRRLSRFSHAHYGIHPLILPQLQTLEIDASNLVIWNEHWHDRTFSDLLARSGCSLRHLSIQDVDFPNDELVRCLALSHELTSFRFIPCPRSQEIGDVIRQLDVSRTAADGQQRVANSGPLIPQLREITLASSAEEYLDLMMEMFRSRIGARAHAAGVATLRHVQIVFFDMSHATDADGVSVPETRLGRLASCRTDLARWVSENENEDSLEASVVVDSPYLVEYIDVP